MAIDYAACFQRLKKAGIDPSADFHALPAAQVDIVRELMGEQKYRQGSGASGSPIRTFFEGLQRRYPSYAKAEPVEAPRAEDREFTVLAAHPDGVLFSLKVRAKDGQQAFGAAAALLDEAEEEGDAQFYAALPGHFDFDTEGDFSFPGDSPVDLDTVREQPDVFGYAGARAALRQKP
jgi:hypothetical protein